MAVFPYPSITRETFTFRDAKGFTARVSFYASFVGTATANDVRTLMTVIGPLITPLTNAALQAANGPWSELGPAQYGAHATGGAYESVQEKAQFVFQDSSGTLHRFQIPAPKVSIFLADKITVDPANTDVAAFVTGFANATAPTNAAFFSSRGGQYMSNFMGGIFVGRKRRRKTNILTLTPGLTASEPE